MATPSKLRPSDENLRRLYESDRLTAQAIADQCQVEKITVLRWLRAAGVERRPAGNGLAARGVTPPTADELRKLIHEDHVGLRGVAEVYGVDYTAVGHWLDRHHIERPTVWGTRRGGREVPEPSESDLRRRVTAGESITSIASAYDVSRTLVRDRCTQYGIEVTHDGWQGGRRFSCEDGHEARSSYEQRVDDWLSTHHLDHEVEPAYPWDRRYRADFLVEGTYIEVWGVTHNPAYAERRAMKIAQCEAHDLRLISINHWQFAGRRRWWKPLESLLA